MSSGQRPIRGRGTAHNLPNRFERLAYEPDPEFAASTTRPKTLYLRDTSRSIISMNDSDDLPFRASVNPYRGCEHGCVYCYARPSHEFLGFSAGLDFETRIVVKEDAPEILRHELASPKWTPQAVMLSGNTDCYQLIDRRLQLTRRCLEVFAEFRNPVSVITKNALVTRDADLLGDLASVDAATVAMSITTLDRSLWRVLEPRTSNPERRLAAIEELNAASIPTSVMVAPVIPGLNDHEIPAILEAARKAGAKSAGYIMLRLPHSLTDLFEEWLELHVPGRRKKVLDRIRSVRGGRLNDTRFGTRMSGEGVFAQQVRRLFEISRRKHGLGHEQRDLSTARYRNPAGRQLDFFG